MYISKLFLKIRFIFILKLIPIHNIYYLYIFNNMFVSVIKNSPKKVPYNIIDAYTAQVIYE